MSALGREMARLLWWYLLYVMRRPWMKRLQKAWLRVLPEKRREGAYLALRKQNRWALKHGLKMLTIAMSFLVISISLTIIYLVAVNLYEAGQFQLPSR